MQAISINRSISIDNLIRSGSIALSILGAVWAVSTRVTTLETATADNKEQITVMRQQIVTLKDAINATNTLATIATNRLNDFGDAIKDIRVDLNKVNERVNMLSQGDGYGQQRKVR